MSVERLLQIHMAVLASLGALLLGIGRESAALPALTLFAASSSVVFTDWLGWFRLNRIIANIAALLAGLYCFSDVLRQGMSDQLLAIANLLVYLQIVLFYQEKNERVYWQLAVLSLLEVVVAAAIVRGLEFFVLLVLYMLVGVSTLAHFFVYRETTPRPQTEDDADDEFAAAGEPSRRGAVLLGGPPTLRTGAASSPRSYLEFSFARQIAALALATLLLAGVFFFSAPRYGKSPWAVPGQSSIGFSGEVSLNERGRLLENNEPVMRVAFQDYETGEPYNVLGDPYFRGTVLTSYQREDGGESIARWRHHTGFRARRGEILPTAPASDNLVRQQVWLEPTNRPVLFSVFPAYRIAETPDDVRVEGSYRHIYRQTTTDKPPAESYHYALGTPAFRDGWQLELTPHTNQRDSTLAKLWFREEMRQLLRFREERFSGLAELSDRIVEEADLEEASVVERAQALERHFRVSDDYTYTLDFDFERDPRVDPIEDFVTRHRKGHCEYFASALVLMLRRQNIPARMVVGYKGGEFNAVGDYYTVRQKHAHAWVEAYVPPHAVDPAMLAGGRPSPGGAWLRLDPTPAALIDVQQAASRNWIDRLTDLSDYAQVLWSDYVLGLDSETQAGDIWRPTFNYIERTAVSVFSLERWRERLAPLVERFWPESWLGAKWFNWRVGMLVMVLGGLLAFLYQAAGFAAARLRVWLRERRARSSTVRVPFYHRLETILAAAGVERRPQQTQRELAAEFARAAERREAWRAVADIPGRVVDAFYRVRFGGGALDKQEAETIEHLLSQLEHALAPPSSS